MYLQLRLFSACPFNCRTCIAVKDDVMECTVCSDKYILNKADCGACPPHCLKCIESNGGLSCEQCKDRTVKLSNGTCQRK